MSLDMARSVTGVYVLGIISGRLLMPAALKRLRVETLLATNLALALGGSSRSFWCPSRVRM